MRSPSAAGPALDPARNAPPTLTSMDLSALQHLLGLAPGRRVACVGDLMVDRFVYGEVSRVSPEAPVPVLARSRELMMLGASGNVARNVAALGGEGSLVGGIGSDQEG